MAIHARFSSLEPLESRIAPAVLVVGANLLGGENPGTGEASLGENSVTLIKVLTGSAIAWYDGQNITSVSFGPNTTLDLTGDVGDLVGNLTASGRLSDLDTAAPGEDGNILLPNNLLGVTTHPLSDELGDIGSIITGGSISNVVVNGHLNGAYAGDGAFRVGESALLSNGSIYVNAGSRVNPLDVNTDWGFTFTAGNSQLTSGASITQLKVAIAEELQVFAGNGRAPGAKGGNISNVRITSAFIEGGDTSVPSYWLRAGDGVSDLFGGAGGSVNGVLEETSNNIVVIRAGDGGAGSVGPGGPGGHVQNIDLQSDSSAYQITAGKGGNGAFGGGAGGSVLQSNFSGKKPNSGIIVAADFTNDGLEDVLVVDSNTGGMVIAQASITGSFSNVVQYLEPVTLDPVVTVTAAGSTPSSAVALDVDGDNDLDIVVSYKNSSSVGIFTNQGGGVFWDATAKAFTSSTVAVDAAPEKLLVGEFGGSSARDLAVIENNQGRGAVQLLLGDGVGGFSATDVAATFQSPIKASAAVVQGNKLGTIFVSTANGEIIALEATGADEDPLAKSATPSAIISGGVATLDVNSLGSELVAVAANGSSVSVFAVTSGGTLTPLATLDSTNLVGRAINARFGADQGANMLNSIVVLSVSGSGSQFSLFAPQDLDGDLRTIDTTYSLGRQLTGGSSFKNFVPAYTFENGAVESYGIAALSGSLSQFTFSQSLTSTTDFGLPFTGKMVSVTAGGGGTGGGSSKGGVGGSVFAINADATAITIAAGGGGNSAGGVAGRGGSISNPASFVTFGAVSLVPSLLADTTLALKSGDGGSVLFNAPPGTKGGIGGAGGAISGLTLGQAAGTMLLTSGDGGAGRGGVGGAGGNISAIIATNGNGGLTVVTGKGGNALAGTAAGGAGGGVSTLLFNLSVAEEDAAEENGFAVSFTTGAGGTSAGGTGGAGGILNGVSLRLNGSDRTYDDADAKPPKIDAHLDNTTAVTVQTGDGGNGATGGAGGHILGFNSVSIFDQVTPDDRVLLNYVVLSLTAGDGGNGSSGAGGAGGNIALKGSAPLQGITLYDPDSAKVGDVPLQVSSGDGGNGKTKGGAGGGISGLIATNAKFKENENLSPTQLRSALIVSGNGGNGDQLEGGKGGDISGLQIATQTRGAVLDGLVVTGGAGGTGGTKGGQGGGIVSSSLVSVDADLTATGGAGGTGTLIGGKGGSLSKLSINGAQYDVGAYVSLKAGIGGNATASGSVGGEGGSVTGITQLKDLNSVINIMQAGDGGAAPSGTGGKGGSVSGVKTVGFIGKPTEGAAKLGVFDASGNPQGIFAGRGGTGSTAGANGGVLNVVARQIAAIAAAYDSSAGTFAIASIVSNVKADVIGYDRDYAPQVPPVFDTEGADGASPSQVKPVDGFILAKVIQGVNAGRASFQFTS